MYTKVWLKFLPVIRIMLKRAITANQVVKMNRTDFDKAGGGRKVGYNFTVEYLNGKVQERQTSLIANDMIAVFQQDNVMQNLLKEKHFFLEMNTKSELSIHCKSAVNEQEDALAITES